MDLFLHPCPCCGSNESRLHTRYKTLAHNERTIYHCFECDIYFSETFATPIAGLKTPLSRIIMILKARSEGMSLNATARTHNVSKKSVIDWEGTGSVSWDLATLCAYTLERSGVTTI